MSLATLNAVPASSIPPSRPGVELAQKLTTLVDEIQRMQGWFNHQIEAQLSSLRQLRAAMQPAESPFRISVPSPFEAAPPLMGAEASPVSPPVVMPMGHATALTSQAAFAFGGSAPAHQAVVLPPAHVTTLDPELEQATLRELNDALSKAFAEISSRGGMLT